jgi:hypothetical protein
VTTLLRFTAGPSNFADIDGEWRCGSIDSGLALDCDSQNANLEAAMAQITLDAFVADVGMLLRDQPHGTAARVTQFIIAWWNGRSVDFAYLREDDETLIEEEMDPLDLDWGEWDDAFGAWLTHPTFARFEEIERWIQEAPPHEEGSGAQRS